MGKGDRRTKRGKIWRGSHGKARPKKKAEGVVKKEESAEKEEKKAE